MTIASLRITDFRNLTDVDLDPQVRGMNVFCGSNGSGKTSLLEAVHFLSIGKSFRSSTSSRLIRHQTEKFSLFAKIIQNNQQIIPIGVERDLAGGTRLRLAEKDASGMAEITASLPVRLINSQSHQLLESGPVFRRKYLDWGLFYQYERFLRCWRQYERVLKQRNAVLKEKRSKQELAVWTDELVHCGAEFDALRRDYIKTLEPLVASFAGELLGLSNIQLHYQCGWDSGQDFATALASSYSDDFRFGYTQVGPHRADFDIDSNGVSVRHFLSRGQQKLLICAMIIAQGALLTGQVNQGLIYLVDDLPSELDVQSRQKLISLLSRQAAQIFITAIEHHDICCFINDNSVVPVKVFHVEHGNVRTASERTAG